jgi:hypothetical protein
VTRTIEIGADADLGSWTSIGSLVRRDSIRVGGRAFNGESASCGFDVDDDSAAKSWPPHRVVRVIEDATSPDTTLGWCRIETDSSGRLGRFDGDARRFDVNLSDRNADVRGIVVTSWSRPAETDVARMRALVADWFDGSYRASTDLTDTYVRNANTVTLPAKKYDAVQAADIAQEIADAAGKIWFVTVDGEAFLDIETSTAYAAAISITDAGTDNQTTIFAPGFDGDAADRDKTEVLSGGVAPYGSSGHKVSERRSTKEAAGDRWEEVLSVDASTSADATSQLGKLLDARSSRTSPSAASSTSGPTRSTSSSTARRSASAAPRPRRRRRRRSGSPSSRGRRSARTSTARTSSSPARRSSAAATRRARARLRRCSTTRPTRRRGRDSV